MHRLKIRNHGELRFAVFARNDICSAGKSLETFLAVTLPITAGYFSEPRLKVPLVCCFFGSQGQAPHWNMPVFVHLSKDFCYE